MIKKKNKSFISPMKIHITPKKNLMNNLILILKITKVLLKKGLILKCSKEYMIKKALINFLRHMEKDLKELKKSKINLVK
jgi:hypothetical protein